MTQPFTEIATDCYGTPPAELERIDAFWPEGIDLDMFADPVSTLRARRRWDIREGVDAYATPLPRGVRRVHGNGPFSGQHPRRTARLFADLHAAHPEVEFLNLTLSAPGLQYWRMIWQTATAVAFLGRLSYVALREMRNADGVITARPGELQDGNRNSAATAFYGPPDRAAAFIERWGADVPTVACRHVVAPRIIIDMATKTPTPSTPGAPSTAVRGQWLAGSVLDSVAAELTKQNPSFREIQPMLEQAGVWNLLRDCTLFDLLPGTLDVPRAGAAAPRKARAKAKPKPKPKAKAKATKPKPKAKTTKAKAKAGAPSVSEATLATMGGYIDKLGVGQSFQMAEAISTTGLGKKTILRALERLNGRAKRVGSGPTTRYEIQAVN